MQVPFFVNKQVHMEKEDCYNFVNDIVYKKLSNDDIVNSVIYMKYNTDENNCFAFMIQCLYGYLCQENIDMNVVNFMFIRLVNILFKYSEEETKFWNDCLSSLHDFYLNVVRYKKEGKRVPHIFVLSGNPGSGKSYIARMLDNIDANLKVIKKYTTRAPRLDEINGVAETQGGCTPEEIEKLEYNEVFESKNERNLFGISKKEIDKALQEGNNVIISSTNYDLIGKIQEDYPCQIHIIQVENLVNSDDEQRKIFETRGSTQEEINNRIGVSTSKTIHDFDYNFRYFLNPIKSFKYFSKEESEKFILYQLKWLFYQFGAELDLEVQKSELFEEFAREFLLEYNNSKYIYPFLNGRFDPVIKEYSGFSKA